METTIQQPPTSTTIYVVPQPPNTVTPISPTDPGGQPDGVAPNVGIMLTMFGIGFLLLILLYCIRSKIKSSIEDIVSRTTRRDGWVL